MTKHGFTSVKAEVNDLLVATGQGKTTRREWDVVLDEGEHWLRSVGAEGAARVVVNLRQKRRRVVVSSSDELTPSARLGRFVLARSLAIASEVDDDEHVAAFRRDHLGDVLLGDDEAVDQWVQARRAQGQVRTVTLYVEPTWQPGDPIDTSAERYAGEGSHGLLEYACGGAVRSVLVGRGSVLDELLALSTHLVRLTGWQAGQATSYVLTGATPVYSMCRLTTPRGRQPGADRVTITVDPDMPVEDVVRAYSQAQRQLRGVRTRRPMPRAVELVVMAGESPGASDHALMQQWNRTHAAEAFPSIRAFRQALRDARRRVLGTPRARR
jgi:hypothetical protein